MIRHLPASSPPPIPLFRSVSIEIAKGGFIVTPPTGAKSVYPDLASLIAGLTEWIECQ
jgi:hypothetical protein